MESLGNFSESSLSGSITATSPTLSVNSLSTFPTTYPFRVVVDSEVMLATGSPGTNQLTVTRGQEGSLAASHTLGAKVAAVVTRQGLLNAIMDRMPTATQILVGTCSITSASGVWQDLRDDSSLAYLEITLGPGRYRLDVNVTAVMAVNATGTPSANLGGRIRDTLGTVYGPEVATVFTQVNVLYCLNLTGWPALATLTTTRTLRVQGNRVDQSGGLTWIYSAYQNPSMIATRLGD